MNPSITFLVTLPAAPATAYNDNHIRLPELFRQADWRVQIAAHDDLKIVNSEVQVGKSPAQTPDIIWPLGFGPHQRFLDRAQLLSMMRTSRTINPALSYFTLHGKSAWLRYAPTTVVACDAVTLADQITSAGGGTWVLKPVAGSFGEDVHLVQNAKEMQDIVENSTGRYWMLQRFIPEIVTGETRTLICGDAVLGSYLRLPDPGAATEFRTNLAVGGQATATRLSAKTKRLVDQVHAELRQADVGFAAIDTVGNYLMEVNLANPGGFGTMCELYGEEFSEQATKNVVREVTRMVSAI